MSSCLISRFLGFSANYVMTLYKEMKLNITWWVSDVKLPHTTWNFTHWGILHCLIWWALLTCFLFGEERQWRQKNGEMFMCFVLRFWLVIWKLITFWEGVPCHYWVAFCVINWYNWFSCVYYICFFWSNCLHISESLKFEDFPLPAINLTELFPDWIQM